MYNVILLVLSVFITLIDAQIVEFTFTSVQSIDYDSLKDGFVSFQFTASYNYSQFEEYIYFNLTLKDEDGYFQNAICIIKPKDRPDYNNPNITVDQSIGLLSSCQIKPSNIFSDLICSNDTAISTPPDAQYNIKIPETFTISAKLPKLTYYDLEKRKFTFRQVNKFEKIEDYLSFKVFSSGKPIIYFE